jgi:tetratricopeptide (TPR) repeat protein
LEILDSLDYDSFEFQILYFNKDLWYAGVYCYGIEEPDLMRSHADKARVTLEDLVKEHPEDPRYRSELSRAYAYLGRKEDAVREGKQAVNLLPVSKDAIGGPRYINTLAEIFIIIGEREQAIEQLEYLMSIPTGVDISLDKLQSDPRYDSLRDHPRFITLVEKYSK